MNETLNAELPVVEATEATLVPVTVPVEGTDVEVVAFLQEGEGEVATTVADETVD